MPELGSSKGPSTIAGFGSLEVPTVCSKIAILPPPKLVVTADTGGRFALVPVVTTLVRCDRSVCYIASEGWSMKIGLSPGRIA